MILAHLCARILARYGARKRRLDSRERIKAKAREMRRQLGLPEAEALL